MIDMKQFMVWMLIALGLSGCTSLGGQPQQASEGETNSQALVVVARDTGYWGNLRVIEAAELAGLSSDNIVFIHPKTDVATVAEIMQRAKNQALYLLPLFISLDHPDWQRWWRALKQKMGSTTATVLPAYGESVVFRRFAVHELPRVDRRTLLACDKDVAFESVVLVLRNAGLINHVPDGRQYLRLTGEKMGEPNRNWEKALLVCRSTEYDPMMSFKYRIRRLASLAEDKVHDIFTPAIIRAWLTYHRSLALHRAGKSKTGIVLLAHGASREWNETMRKAYTTENPSVIWAFSMANREVLAHAVEKLRSRGATEVMIVRIFGRSSSFRTQIERLFALRCRGTTPQHHEHYGSEPIPIDVPVVTVGGLDDAPELLASAAWHVEQNSDGKRPVALLLTAHGLGDPKLNAEWARDLGEMAKALQRRFGRPHLARVGVVTWQEDWPEQSRQQIENAKQFIRAAKTDGLPVLVVSMRTNGTGPERHFLKGEDFTLAGGLAQTPYFAVWLARMIETGHDELAKMAEAKIRIKCE